MELNFSKGAVENRTGSSGSSFREASSESSEKTPVHGQSWLAKERMASGMSENKQDAIRENSKGISAR